MNKNRRCKYCNWLNKEVLTEFICENCKRKNSITEKEEVVEEKKVSNWPNDLARIKGIGNETVEDVKRIYASEEELKIALKRDNVPLRNDVVEKLKKHFITMKGGNY